MRRHLAAMSVGLAVLLGAAARVEVQTPPPFAATVAELSEAGGYFDTDNLISNERSYLQVAPALKKAAVDGGVYVGVGPDTSFSYIAQTRPALAFIIDIRRDNLLLHLFFKALFQIAPTRVEFASLLFGRAPPADVEAWRAAGADRLVAHLEGPVAAAGALAAAHAKIVATIRAFGVPVSADEWATIARDHRTFIESGVGLKFETTGRAPSYAYPTYGDLVLEMDPSGQRANYLAHEDDFQFVRGLELHDLVIPVVGDLAGPTAMRRIGALMAARGLHLGAFYASNVEFYLFREGTFPQFADNLSHLPHTPRSVVIRSVFGGGAGLVPYVPGYASASILGGVEAMLQANAAGRVRDYTDLISLR